MDAGELRNFKKFFENFAGKIGCFKKYCSVACITGGIAEAFYRMPQELRDDALKCLPEDIREEYGGGKISIPEHIDVRHKMRYTLLEVIQN